MRYKFWVFFLICLSIALLFFSIDTPVRKLFFSFTDPIKLKYHYALSSIQDTYDKFFNQAKMIAFYKQKYQEYQKLSLQLKDTQEKLDGILHFYPQLHLFDESTFAPAMVSSYVEFSQYDKVWLHTSKQYYKDQIFGIVHEGYALGIAVVDEDRLLGLLNGNEKCSYSVYIGEQKIPALVRFNPSNKELLLADFIPQYFKINEGDEVITSGLDHIFIPNIPVGKIKKISNNSGYVTADIFPYANTKSLKYLYLIDRKQDEKRF